MDVIQPSPWEAYQPAEPEHEYLTLVSCLRFRGPGGLDRFQALVGEVVEQLASAPGLLGWSMADSENYSYLTLSAWVDDASLRAFMLADPHRRAMRELRSVADGTFVRYRTMGRDLAAGVERRSSTASDSMSEAWWNVRHTQKVTA